MWHAILQALSAILTPILRELVSQGMAATKGIDVHVNHDARRRWTQRVRKFTSSIRS